MNRVFAIIGLVILAIAIVYLTQGISKTAPTEDEADQAQRVQQQAQVEKQRKAIIAQITPTGPSNIPQSEETLGNPATAKHHIKVGWFYDEDNLKNPEQLIIPLQTVAKFVEHENGKVSAVIVDLDVPREDRSPAAQSVTDVGMQFDGNHPFFQNFSGGMMSQDELEESMASGMREKVPSKQ